MFTLVFTDKKQQKYSGTAARFQQYCTKPRIGPVISRGEAPLEASNYRNYMLHGTYANAAFIYIFF